MKSTRNASAHTRRDAWLDIDLGAIEHNVSALRRRIPESIAMMAVLKADAYGHGAAMVIPTLEACGVTMVGVAAMDEALALRDAGVTLPILILGVTPDWAMQNAVMNDIQMTIFSQRHLDALEKLYQHTNLVASVQIKVDVGMHRIGVPWEEAPAFITHCQSLPFVKVEGVFSHLPYGTDCPAIWMLYQRWESVLAELKDCPLYHLSASSGLEPVSRLTRYNTMVRLGITLFGYQPPPAVQGISLEPSMAVKARIVHLMDLEPGESVSYNRTYSNRTETTQRIATLPIGYADGVPRKLSNKMEVLFRGKRLKQVGNITMDQMMVDMTEVPEAMVGDIVTLIGISRGPYGLEFTTLVDWTEHTGIIAYELMCQLRVRLPKTYSRSVCSPSCHA